MICKNCGNEIPEGSKFCPACGKEAENTAGEGAVSKKSRTEAMLFGIFFGSIGVHNFYLGQVGKGIAKILLTVFGSIFCSVGFTKMMLLAFRILRSGWYYDTPYSTLLDCFLAMLGSCMILGATIWSLVEWILIASGKAKDSKGLPVSRW